MDECKNKSIVLYQGIISKDRPLSNIARALAEINDGNVIFWIMGKGDEQVVDEARVFIKTPYILVMSRARNI